MKRLRFYDAFYVGVLVVFVGDEYVWGVDDVVGDDVFFDFVV